MARNIYKIVWKNFIDSFKPRQFRGNLVGKDHLGNQYYEIDKSNRNRRARWFVPKDGNEDNFESSQLPAEWEAWLRLRRKVPPTEEEIMMNLELMKTKKAKAAEINKKFKSDATPGNLFAFPRRDEYEDFPGSKKV